MEMTFSGSLRNVTKREKETTYLCTDDNVYNEPGNSKNLTSPAIL